MDSSDEVSLEFSFASFLEEISKEISISSLLIMVFVSYFKFFLSLKKENLLAFGDGYNDISMLRYAGLGVAMANASEEVKKAANRITLSNDEDGVARILEELFPLK